MTTSVIRGLFMGIATIGVASGVLAQITTWRLLAAMKRHDRPLWEREAGLQWFFYGLSEKSSLHFLWRRGYQSSSSWKVRKLGMRARSLFAVAAVGWCVGLALLMVLGAMAPPR